MKKAYTKYIAIIKYPEDDIGIDDVLTMACHTELIGHVEDAWKSLTLTVNDMRAYLNGEYQIKWDPDCEIGDPDDPQKMEFALLPIYSEELTVDENYKMISWAVAKAYISIDFLDYHEKELINLLGEELFTKLYEELVAGE